MVKSYLKYEHGDTLGLITSGISNIVWTADPGRNRGRAVVGAGETILNWDLKKGELVNRWKDRNGAAEVTAIARSPNDHDVYAVGYADGSIRLWDSRLATILITFNGHRTAVTALAFDKPGTRLASGAQDTDIVVWDLIAETGLFKLRGHTNQITGLYFIEPDLSSHAEDSTITDSKTLDQSHMLSYLLSVGKDALLKLWDLNGQHCVETHVTQSHGECWALAVSPSNDGCVTAGNDGELRFWTIDLRSLIDKNTSIDETNTKCLLERGAITRQGRDRTLGVKFHPKLAFIAAHGTEKSLEIFRIRSENEARKSLARKRKRRREKAAKQTNGINANGIDEADKVQEQDDSTPDVSDFIIPLLNLRTTGKLRSFDWAGHKVGGTVQVLVETTNNQIEVYDLKHDKEDKPKAEPPDYNRAVAVDIPGHRTDVRSISLSSDDRLFASASNGSLKIWNVRTRNCLRSLDCGYALCSAFLPGDKIVAVGNRNGEIELFDISASSLIETVKAHEGAVWSLHVHPDGRSMVTGSADKSAKFWKFEVVQESVPGSRRTTSKFTMVHTRTLKLNDDILSIRYSPDARLIAAATLDNTVKIFFVDSLKLFLNLYGHKLPVLSMDISYDSKLIVTCSADKNVRIWGLDFGDCHKALFAHQDSIMQVAFVPHDQDGNGHHFFSASKDRFIKYWDGDKFEQIQKLSGHHGEIWAMAVSRTGDFLVTASHDKSMRIWRQTDEQIFLEEERERELEELYETTLVANLDDEEGQERSEVAAAGKQTIETLMAGEKIAEALALGIEDLAVMRSWKTQKADNPSAAPPQRNLIFMAYGNISAEQHVLAVIEKIPAAALQDALLVLTFDQVRTLFTFIGLWTERKWNTPLVCRILFFLLKTHHRQIIVSRTMRPTLDEIRTTLRNALQVQKNEMGFNLAALRVLGDEVREKASKQYVDEDAWLADADSLRARKRSFVNVA